MTSVVPKYSIYYISNGSAIYLECVVWFGISKLGLRGHLPQQSYPVSWSHCGYLLLSVLNPCTSNKSFEHNLSVRFIETSCRSAM